MTIRSERDKRREKLRREHDAAIESVCQGALGKSRSEAVAAGNKFSGGAIAGFREGWAIIPFSHKPHYWQRRDLTHEFTALCGFEIDQTNYHPGAQVQFAPGNFMNERCKRCARKASAEESRP